MTAERTAELLARWTKAQTTLVSLWAAVARDLADRFSARAAAMSGTMPACDVRRLYNLWIDCGEEAYAAVAHTEEYCRAQAELINTAVASSPQPGWLQLQPPLHAAAAGCSLRDAVWRQDQVVLYRYRPLPFVQRARPQPVLICYALVNRPYVLDLQPDRSLVRSLLAAGLEVYLLDWGYAGQAERRLALGDYINRYLDGSVRHVLEREQTPVLNLLGVCQGGTLSLCYTALHPDKIAHLVLLATPVDFQTPENLLSKWARHLDVEALTGIGNLSGAQLTCVFLALSPFRLLLQKHAALLDQLTDPHALALFGRMEQWIFDSPDQAATAAGEFLRWFYQENRLVRGQLTIDAQQVSLKRIRQPVLNVYAMRDHIIPPSATRALGQHVGTLDYTEQAIDAGHVGLYVSRQAGRNLARSIASWLSRRSSRSS